MLRAVFSLFLQFLLFFFESSYTREMLSQKAKAERMVFRTKNIHETYTQIKHEFLKNTQRWVGIRREWFTTHCNINWRIGKRRRANEAKFNEVFIHYCTSFGYKPFFLFCVLCFMFCVLCVCLCTYGCTVCIFASFLGQIQTCLALKQNTKHKKTKGLKERERN